MEREKRLDMEAMEELSEYHPQVCCHWTGGMEGRFELSLDKEVGG